MTTLYLHGNQLMSLNEVKRLSGLPCLRTLTLHGEFESYSSSAVTQDWLKTPLNAFLSVTDISLIVRLRPFNIGDDYFNLQVLLKIQITRKFHTIKHDKNFRQSFRGVGRVPAVCTGDLAQSETA